MDQRKSHQSFVSSTLEEKLLVKRKEMKVIQTVKTHLRNALLKALLGERFSLGAQMVEMVLGSASRANVAILPIAYVW